ncbi:hypothetical protein WJX81_001381 [Elliptochloris bilobata]|uniref:CCT domain-containing protein n=1 Tax=Elliptochloris bilobata TaxID=381761 RepID=A0AAW1SHN3_9CHLO
MSAFQSAQLPEPTEFDRSADAATGSHECGEPTELVPMTSAEADAYDRSENTDGKVLTYLTACGLSVAGSAQSALTFAGSGDMGPRGASGSGELLRVGSEGRAVEAGGTAEQGALAGSGLGPGPGLATPQLRQSKLQLSLGMGLGLQLDLGAWHYGPGRGGGPPTVSLDPPLEPPRASGPAAGFRGAMLEGARHGGAGTLGGGQGFQGGLSQGVKAEASGMAAGRRQQAQGDQELCGGPSAALLRSVSDEAARAPAPAADDARGRAAQDGSEPRASGRSTRATRAARGARAPDPAPASPSGKPAPADGGAKASPADARSFIGGVECGRGATGSPGEGGTARAGCLERYREKKRRRLFSNIIRYEKRKVNANNRPRIKGRFVRLAPTAPAPAGAAEAPGPGVDEAEPAEAACASDCDMREESEG